MKPTSLRQLRELAGLTQVELAERLDMTQAQISKLEARTDCKLSTLQRVVKALDGELEVKLGRQRVSL